jgi:hypothetical protein
VHKHELPTESNTAKLVETGEALNLMIAMVSRHATPKKYATTNDP